jgi:hypothetical protein
MAKRMIQDSISVGANSTNSNVLSGKRFENLGNNALMTLYATGSAAGLQVELFSGNRAVIEKSAVGAENRIPIDEDRILDEIEGFAGEKLQMSVSNNTGGALTYFYRLEFDDGVAFA